LYTRVEKGREKERERERGYVPQIFDPLPHWEEHKKSKKVKVKVKE
jgi:hypothetical protein